MPKSYDDIVDVTILRRAAEVLRRRSKRQGFVLDVFCTVLTKLADKIEEESRA